MCSIHGGAWQTTGSRAYHVSSVSSLSCDQFQFEERQMLPAHRAQFRWKAACLALIAAFVKSVLSRKKR